MTNLLPDVPPRNWTSWRAAICSVAALLLVCSWVVSPAYVLGAAIAFALLGAILLAPVVGLCALVLSVPWSTALPGGSLPFTSTDIVAALLGGAWLLESWYESVDLSELVWLPFLAFYVAAITLSTSQAADWHASLREIVKWIEVAITYVAAVRFIRREWHLRAVIACVVAAGTSQALLGFLQFAAQRGPAAFRHGAFLRAYGTFDQPNPYAGFLNMTLPLALAGALLAPGRRERTIYRACTILIFAALALSESRGALIAGIVASVAVLGCIRHRLAFAAWSVSFAGICGALLATYGLVPTGPFVRVLGTIGLGNVSFGSVTNANFSAIERAAHWLAGVRMFAAHPLLGVGIGNYAAAYPAYHPRGWYAALAHAHNYYINAAAESGVVGLTAYVLLTGSALWYSYAARNQVRNALHRIAVLGVLGALIATGIHNLFDVLYVHGMATLLGLLVALVTVAMRLEAVEADWSNGDQFRGAE